MSLTPRRALCSLVLALVAAPVACGSTPTPPALPVAAPTAASPSSAVAVVAAEPPDGEIPKLRTGALARIEHAQVL